ncbi:MAG: polysaccharide biosynthesis/export family protein [Muribaculaceae bacterium]|nr:polysaccharide biosynthesis/export family protein [Muribaculaceae bacterium]
MKLSRILLVCAGTALLMLSSCKAPQNIAYFQNEEMIFPIAQQEQFKLQPGDKLNIIVKAKDPMVSELFNLPTYSQRLGASSSTSSASGATSQVYRGAMADGVSSYTVTPQGMIDFPVLGMLKVAGMTRAELAGFIKGELVGRDLVKDPTVIVEFLNTGINVLGAVNTPGRYEVNADSYTLLEALAVAGDLQIGGQRENIKVLREEDGSIRVYTIDITDLKKAAGSPAFYLRPNDVVYVEPNDMMKRSSTINGNNALSTSFWISVASLVTTAVTTIGVFVK